MLLIFINSLFLLSMTNLVCILATAHHNSPIYLYKSYKQLFINHPLCVQRLNDVIDTYLNIQKIETKLVLNSGSKLTCKLSHDYIPRRHKSEKRQICLKTPFFQIEEAFIQLQTQCNEFVSL
jgi:hypothetical protein